MIGMHKAQHTLHIQFNRIYLHIYFQIHIHIHNNNNNNNNSVPNIINLQ